MSTKYRFGIVFALLLSIAACSSVSTPPSPPAMPNPPAPKTIEEGFLREERTEIGIPILIKIPYLHRLFSNTAISYQYVWDDLLCNSSAAISSDGKWLLVGKCGGSVSLWNLYDPKDCRLDIVPSISGKQETAAAWLRFTPDASAFLVFRQHLLEPSGIETMTLHDRASGKELRTIPIESKFRAGTISPDGELLLVAGATSLEYWNLHSGQKVASVPLGNLGDVTDIQCTPDQRFLFLPSSTGLHIFDFHSLRKINSDPDKLYSRVAVSPNRQTLAVAFSSCSDIQYEGGILIYEIGTWRLLREIRPKNQASFVPEWVRFSRDGKSLLALAFNIQVRTKEWIAKGGLFCYDLDQPNGSWKEIEYKTLPLHPEGKYLLNGQFGSASYLSPFMEQMGIDF